MSSDFRVDAILTQFPGPVTLKASRRKWLLVLVVSLVFVAVLIWVIWEDGKSANPQGWLGLIFMGTVAVVATVVVLFPGADALRVDRDGFEITSLFRRYRSRWQDVSEFELAAIGWNTIVIYDDRMRSGLTWLSVAVCGRNAGLPDTYGFAAASLANLMTRWRERAISTSGRSRSC